MRNIFLVFITLLLMGSCSLNNSEKTKTAQINYIENLRVYLSKNYKKFNEGATINTVRLTNVTWINNFYKEIKHHPIWIDDSLRLNKNAKDLTHLLSTSYNYGLDTSFYFASTILNLEDTLTSIHQKEKRYQTAAQLEILLTNSYFLFGKDLNYGIVPKDSSKLVSLIPRKEFSINLTKNLLLSFETDSVATNLLKVQPQQPEYLALQKQLSNYLKTASLSKGLIKVEQFRKDSIKAFEQSKMALILHHYLSENSSDSAYSLALAKFQIQHGLKADGLIGKNTAKALSKSPYSDYEKIAMSLEKWRWVPKWDSNYIYVNIPSYLMKVYQNNVVKSYFNVVVGKTDKQTPEINDEMEYMIVFPFWNLPYSISSKELLPKIKKDSTYLKRNGYKVFTDKHKSLNSDEINWNTVTEENFNYKIRQNGGRTNSLGLIKFIFPNKNSVYFHDTPSKRYFKNDIRAYSHGCVRVQHPLQLANLILRNDQNKYTADSVDTFIANRKHQRITLNKHIPVHIQYFTAGIDSSGTLIFYKDIYQKDDKLKELMKLSKKAQSLTKHELASK